MQRQVLTYFTILQSIRQFARVLSGVFSFFAQQRSSCRSTYARCQKSFTQNQHKHWCAIGSVNFRPVCQNVVSYRVPDNRTNKKYDSAAASPICSLVGRKISTRILCPGTSGEEDLILTRPVKPSRRRNTWRSLCQCSCLVCRCGRRSMPEHPSKIPDMSLPGRPKNRA